MREPLLTSIRASRAHLGPVVICLLIQLALAGVCVGQSAPVGEYQAYQLRHKDPANIESMLREMLAGLDATTHVVADSRAGQILVLGPSEAQRIAEQLIESVDKPSQTPQRSTVKAYPVESGRLTETAERLRSTYGTRYRIRVAPDPQNPRLLILAPPEVHELIARDLAPSEPPAVPEGPTFESAKPSRPASRLEQLLNNRRPVDIGPGRRPSRLGTDSATAPTETPPPRQELAPGQQPAPGREPATGEQFVPLVHSQIDWVEASLGNLLGDRLTQRVGRRDGQREYVFTDAVGERVELRFDRSRNGLTVFGAEALARQLVRLVHILDSPRDQPGRKVRVVTVRRADPNKILEAVHIYQSGYRRGLQEKPSSEADSTTNGQSQDTQGDDPAGPAIDDGANRPADFDHGGIRLVSYLFQVQGQAGSVDVGGGGADVEIGGGEAPGEGGLLADDPDRAQQRLEESARRVEIESLPDLDVIILRGPDYDVDQITQLIEMIEELSVEREPKIDVYYMKHVQAESLSTVALEVAQDLLGGHQGRVSVTPLEKPNALLLIGWGEAVDVVRELIAKLDQPVAPQTRANVYRLRHAPVVSAAETLEDFFTSRSSLGGLRPEVRITTDPRTNSLIVQAPPRDMAEVELLIEALDTDENEWVTQVRILKLKNSLALDLAATLDQAIAVSAGAEGSSVLELFDVDAAGERLIRSGILADVRVTADPRTNTLLISASAESMDLVTALVKQLDSPAAVAQIKVFRIENGDASSLIQMLESLLPASTGPMARPSLPGAEDEGSLVPIRFSVDVRTNSIIATGSQGDLNIVEALLLRLDGEDVQQRQNEVYRLKNAPAVDVATAINEFLRSERTVQQATVGTVSPFQQIESEVIVVPEIVSNSLIISATPRFYEDILELVKKLDEAPLQVMIQVLIAEVRLDDTDEFGIEVGLQDSVLFDRSLLSNLLTTTQTTQSSTAGTVTTVTEDIIVGAENTPGFLFANQANNASLGNAGSDKAFAHSNIVGSQGLTDLSVNRVNSDLGFGGLVLSASSESVSLLIRALQESKRAEVLGRPQIMTLDNQPAFIQVGKRVPFITGSTVNTRGMVNNISMENVGLILAVTPRISPEEGKVVMEVDAEKSELGSTQEGIPIAVSDGQEIRSPSINVTLAQTTVSAANGETIILGGLITKSNITVKRRVPGLADIPILGHLFRYDFETTQRSELLIILTPHIISSPEEAQRIKQIEATRMHWCLAEVNELHGDTGLYDVRSGLDDEDLPTVYPDGRPLDPLPDGLLPLEPTPTESQRPPPLDLGPPVQGPRQVAPPPTDGGYRPAAPYHERTPAAPAYDPQILPTAARAFPSDDRRTDAAVYGEPRPINPLRSGRPREAPERLAPPPSVEYRPTFGPASSY